MSIKPIFAAVALSLTLMSGAAYAAGPNAPVSCCYPKDQDCKANEAAMEAARTAIRQKQAEEVLPTPAGDTFSNGSCLDALMDSHINILFEMPSLDSIIGSIIDYAKNAACKAVQSQVNSMMSQVNLQLGTSVNVPIVGQVLKTGVGTAAGAGGVTMSGSGTSNVGTYSATGVTSSVTNGVQSVQNTATSTVNAVKTTATNVQTSATGTASTIQNAVK